MGFKLQAPGDFPKGRKTMRKIFLLMNTSLDGYFEAPGHDISWAKADFEAFSTEQAKEVDTLLFGRTTYGMMKNFWPTSRSPHRA